MNYEELLSHLGMARKEHEKGNFPEAETICNEVLSKLPHQKTGDEEWRKIQDLRSNALYYLSLALTQLLRYDEALTNAEHALKAAIESGTKVHEGNAYEAIGWVNRRLGTYPLALENFQTMQSIFQEINDKEGNSRALHGLGVIYCDGLADYAKALDCFSASLPMFEQLNDKYRIAQTYGSFSSVYLSIGLLEMALDYRMRELALCEEIGSKHSIASSRQNLSVIHINLGMYDKALENIAQTISAQEQMGDRLGVAIEVGNIGVIHFYRAEYALALEYFSRSLAIYSEEGKKTEIAMQLGNIGEVYSMTNFEGHDAQKAEEYLLKAIALNEELGNKPFDQYRALAEMYHHEERWKESDSAFRKYISLEKEVLNDTAKKKATQLEQQRQVAEREKEIAIAKAIAEAEMNLTTSLLHKVLPPSIASRLIKGEKVADYFTSVSILFADIVGFTPIASRMPARKVLAFLNFVFGEFDRIIEKHGCEKIKTIGDGYMAVAGAPIECSDHAERIARAAMEMMGDIQLPEDIRTSLPKGSKFSIRFGIHIGPAFGGIVGEKRFVYDIYSDAVNTAARMESHGEPGRIHVSEDFAFHLQNRMDMTGDDLGGITFVEREEIEIKGKGMMKTYFLEAKS